MRNFKAAGSQKATALFPMIQQQRANRISIQQGKHSVFIMASFCANYRLTGCGCWAVKQGRRMHPVLDIVRLVKLDHWKICQRFACSNAHVTKASFVPMIHGKELVVRLAVELARIGEPYIKSSACVPHIQKKILLQSQCLKLSDQYYQKLSRISSSPASVAARKNSPEFNPDSGLDAASRAYGLHMRPYRNQQYAPIQKPTETI
eukprot:1148904-Pelagomonas_calceolata.AAC.1